MPAVSKAQRTAIAIAEHHPDKLYDRNKGLLSMSKSSMHDFAATSAKGLPEKKSSTPKYRDGARLTKVKPPHLF